MTERVITLIDMDCFYCQVESRLNPELVGKPMAVVQYNAWKGGGIIAVNYEARAKGVGRHCRGDDAKALCPEIILVPVPQVREKADLSKYRDAGKEVIQVLIKFGAVVERASVDEAYVDITKLVEEKLDKILEVTPDLLPNSHVVGHESELTPWLGALGASHDSKDDLRLAVGGSIVEEMRSAVFNQTQFRCSAGIAHNKMLAKLACGIHKPNQQTILPQSEVHKLFTGLKVSKLRGLGGKLGDNIVDAFQVETVADLSKISLGDLKQRFEEKTAQWLHNISRGLEFEIVRERDLPKSIGCSKNFPGIKSLDTKEKVEYWVRQLAEEVCERLEKDREDNGRVARGLTISITQDGKGHSSRAGPLNTYDCAKICRQAMGLIGNMNEAKSSEGDLWRPRLKNVSVSASKFEEDSGTTQSIATFFTASAANGSGSCSTPKSDSNDSIKTEEKANPDTAHSSGEKVNAEDLVPNLEGFDASILECLPPKLRDKVNERVKMLRESAKPNVKTSLSPATVQKKSPPLHETNLNPSPEKHPCEKCQKLINPFELPEHLDFHVAQELQSEISRDLPPIPVRTVVMPRKGASSSSSSSGGNSAGQKRKKGPGSTGLNGQASKKQKDIKSFFQNK